MNRFEVSESLRAFGDYRATHATMVPVQFQRMLEFEHFADTGSRAPRAREQSPSDPEMVLFYSAEEAQKDFAPENKGAVLIGMMLPFHVASSSGKRR
jgi:hypothetical protein